jgi:hypothetical protein
MSQRPAKTPSPDDARETVVTFLPGRRIHGHSGECNSRLGHGPIEALAARFAVMNNQSRLEGDSLQPRRHLRCEREAPTAGRARRRDKTRSPEHSEHLRLGVAGVLDIVPEVLFDVANVAWGVVHRDGVRTGVEDRLSALALDPTLPFVALRYRNLVMF